MTTRSASAFWRPGHIRWTVRASAGLALLLVTPLGSVAVEASTTTTSLGPPGTAIGHPPPAGTDALVAVSCPVSAKCWAVGATSGAGNGGTGPPGPAIIMTGDGGVTWRARRSPPA